MSDVCNSCKYLLPLSFLALGRNKSLYNTVGTDDTCVFVSFVFIFLFVSPFDLYFELLFLQYTYLLLRLLLSTLAVMFCLL